MIRRNRHQDRECIKIIFNIIISHANHLSSIIHHQPLSSSLMGITQRPQSHNHQCCGCYLWRFCWCFPILAQPNMDLVHLKKKTHIQSLEWLSISSKDWGKPCTKKPQAFWTTELSIMPVSVICLFCIVIFNFFRGFEAFDQHAQQRAGSMAKHLISQHVPN